MFIKVLGSGCANCGRLEQAAREAVVELGIDAEVEKVTGFDDIVSYGVMATPALVVDEKVVSAGRALTKDEVVKILQASSSED